MHLDIRPGVAESLPFEDESVDFVNAYSVLEHVDDPDQVLREVFRVLRRPGAFLFSTIERASARSRSRSPASRCSPGTRRRCSGAS